VLRAPQRPLLPGEEVTAVNVAVIIEISGEFLRPVAIELDDAGRKRGRPLNELGSKILDSDRIGESAFDVK
jgi:hypothetical protein